ncbi:MAG: divalent cation tolerance protein CutA, partial [Nanoarchaeota archaeon]|nr:divalent cation tolerance protein CutA [Nanoarchaeota archaeon]
KEIKKLHSYEIPAIIKMTAKVNEEYLEWAESVIE